jgi:hypothetical protein
MSPEVTGWERYCFSGTSTKKNAYSGKKTIRYSHWGIVIQNILTLFKSTSPSHKRLKKMKCYKLKDSKGHNGSHL